MRINLQVRNFQRKILSVVNQEPMPLEIKRLVLEEVISAVSKAADEAVEAEEKEENAETAQEMAEKKEGNNECME